MPGLEASGAPLHATTLLSILSPSTDHERGRLRLHETKSHHQRVRKVHARRARLAPVELIDPQVLD
eukprot:COSAG02_NODE_557_length_20379_cov_6.688215_20_plen_66_part_00